MKSSEALCYTLVLYDAGVHPVPDKVLAAVTKVAAEQGWELENWTHRLNVGIPAQEVFGEHFPFIETLLVTLCKKCPPRILKNVTLVGIAGTNSMKVEFRKRGWFTSARATFHIAADRPVVVLDGAYPSITTTVRDIIHRIRIRFM